MENESGGIPAGTPVEINLSYLRELEPEVYPSPHRLMRADVTGTIKLNTPRNITSAEMEGQLLNVRSLFSWYGAPPDIAGLEMTQGELGKFFEIGQVYTWIAGLLNLLAIWDAVCGPAYGYGNPEEDKTEPPKDTPTSGTPPPSPPSLA